MIKMETEKCNDLRVKLEEDSGIVNSHPVIGVLQSTNLVNTHEEYEVRNVHATKCAVNVPAARDENNHEICESTADLKMLPMTPWQNREEEKPTVSTEIDEAIPCKNVIVQSQSESSKQSVGDQEKGSGTNNKVIERICPKDDNCHDTTICTCASMSLQHLKSGDTKHSERKSIGAIMKRVVSLATLKKVMSEGNNDYVPNFKNASKMEMESFAVEHNADEFFSFCSCQHCLEYREVIMKLIIDQCNTQHLVVKMVEAIIQMYKPMLKNPTARKRIDNLLSANRDVYWISCGQKYSKMNEHVDLMYNNKLTNHMVILLYSSILLVNDPLLLLQILSFHMECVFKAYADGFLEIVDEGSEKLPSEDMLKYILDGFDEMCRISERVSSYLFAFENDFLRKLSLTWTFLCQRLYRQFVHLCLADTIVACIMSLKEDKRAIPYPNLIRKYIQFVEKMAYIDKWGTNVWMEFNKFNLSEVEREKRLNLFRIYNNMEALVEDAIELFGDDNYKFTEIQDIIEMEDRELAWKKIMLYLKKKHQKGFYSPPYAYVCEEKCENCDEFLDRHIDTCICLTCSIAGGSQAANKRNWEKRCLNCISLLAAEKVVASVATASRELKTLDVLTLDDILRSTTNKEPSKAVEGGDQITKITKEDGIALENERDSSKTYHVAWVVFRHLNKCKRYKHHSIEEKHFCKECNFHACRLARKILNNDISLILSIHLIRSYQPLVMAEDEIHSILPDMSMYNRKVVISNMNIEPAVIYHDPIIKIYWTFLISFYATYFIDCGGNCPLRLENLQLTNGDITLQFDKIVGNASDNKFFQFLEKLKSLGPKNDEIELSPKGGDGDLSKMEKQQQQQHPLRDANTNNIVLKTCNSKATPTQPATPTAPAIPEKDFLEKTAKNVCKDKTKKCCLDSADATENCKSNHFTKRHLKRECTYARVNETRDRLRKKLSLLATLRKNVKTTLAKQEIEVKEKNIQTIISASGSIIKVKLEDSTDLEDLDAFEQIPFPMDGNKMNLAENDGVGVAAAAAEKRCEADECKVREEITSNSDVLLPAENACTTHHDGSTLTLTRECSEARSDEMIVPGVQQTEPSQVKKWINATLNYIEGPNGSGGGKQQPQPTSAKKAAKKAKQKQRKEEEKRIMQLQDYRSQYDDIYVKEFTNKYELKMVKANKKRDKKRITDLEANIKRLQRAKAKVEAFMLEIIATIKQTNAQFKFPYLPTKEQQLNILKALQANGGGNSHPHMVATNQHHGQRPLNVGGDNGGNTTTTTTTIAASDRLAMSCDGRNDMTTATAVASTANCTLPYSRASNSFPYHVDVHHSSSVTMPPPPSIYSVHNATLPAVPPLCYAPPPSHHLAPETMAAMANASMYSGAGNGGDPSKRIVTIRRINLPNVPEPQVTVTAKGSSPDKDKLLYTFVNGQLVQTEASAPPIAPLGRSSNYALAAKSLSSSSSSPPAPVAALKLSKTQRKKELRRLAKNNDGSNHHGDIIVSKLQQLKLHNKEHEHEHEHEKPSPQNKIIALPIQKTACKKLKNKKMPTSTSTHVMEAKTTATSTVKTTNRTNKIAWRCSSSTTVSSSPSLSSSGQATNTSDVVTTTFNAKPLHSTKSKKGKEQRSDGGNSTTGGKGVVVVVARDDREKDEQRQTKKTKVASNARKEKLIDNGQFDNNPFRALQPGDLSSSTESLTQSSSDEVDEEKKCTADGVGGGGSIVAGRKRPNEQHNNLTKVTMKVSKDKESSLDVLSSKKKQPNSGTSSRSLQGQSQIRPVLTNNRNGGGGGGGATVLDHRSPTASLVDLSFLFPGGKKQRNGIKVAEDDNDEDTSRAPQRTKQLKSKQCSQSRKCRIAEQQQQQQDEQPLVTLQCRQKSRTNHIVSAVAAVTSQRQQQQQQQKRNDLTWNKTNNRKQQQHQAALHSPSLVESSLNGQQQQQQQQSHNMTVDRCSTTALTTSSNPPMKRIKARHRDRKKSLKAKGGGAATADDNDAMMEMMHGGDFTVPSPQIKQQQKQYQQLRQCQEEQYAVIQQQMQNLHIGTVGTQQRCNYTTPGNYVLSAHGVDVAGDSDIYANAAAAAAATAAATKCNANNSTAINVSIMDQLNRGVQVENLSLPPGITLTKVDPVKSEQLRKKSESIKKLAKPLERHHHHHHHQHQHQHHVAASPQSFHPTNASAAIIAPPTVAGVPSYYGTPYAGVAAATVLGQSGVIMLEAMSRNNKLKQDHQEQLQQQQQAPVNVKTSKGKKKRNKSSTQAAKKVIQQGGGGGDGGTPLAGGMRTMPAFMGTTTTATTATMAAGEQPNIVTLRNPMFHKGAGLSPSVSSSVTPQANLIAGPGRTIAGLPLITALPMDQPAAIIKSENGMFTIRNPALQQAVANGFAVGGYRQLGGVNYYAPQEHAAATTTTTTSVAAAGRTTVHESSSAAATTFAAAPLLSSSSSSTTTTTTTTTCNDNGGAFSYFSNSPNETKARCGGGGNSSSSGDGDGGGGHGRGGDVNVRIGTSGDDANRLYREKSSTLRLNSGDGRLAATSLPLHNHDNGIVTDFSTPIPTSIATPASIATPIATKCLSAIGSEMKNAQQQKQKSIESSSQWTHFGAELTNIKCSDSLSCDVGNHGGHGGSNANSSLLSGGSTHTAITNNTLHSDNYHHLHPHPHHQHQHHQHQQQQQQQHSPYYNGGGGGGFDVFTAHGGGASNAISSTTYGRMGGNRDTLFDMSDCHLHHNCGDDSPPPTITGFNRYLEGIPNTGVIQYNDASFLKTLMPGQNPNKEVPIHDASRSAFSRNLKSVTLPSWHPYS